MLPKVLPTSATQESVEYFVAKLAKSFGPLGYAAESLGDFRYARECEVFGSATRRDVDAIGHNHEDAKSTEFKTSIVRALRGCKSATIETSDWHLAEQSRQSEYSVMRQLKYDIGKPIAIEVFSLTLLVAPHWNALPLMTY